MKFRKPLEAENKEDHARQISGDYGNGFHNRVLLFDWQPFHGVNHIYLNIVDEVYFWEIQFSYDARLSSDGPRLAHIVVMKAMRALTEVRSRWY